jgi:hypothetical protein
VTVRALFGISGCAIFFALVGASASTKKISPELASVDRKIAHLEANGRAARPSASPTILTEAEINAYLASDEVDMPAGVQSVRLSGSSGTVSGTARIDFDKVRAGTNSSNPLLSIFSGSHEVTVETHAYGKGGQGYVHVDSVSLDGIEVPHFVLELFVEKYLSPRYPQIGMDSLFTLPDRIDTAVVGQHQVTLVQK